MQFHPSIFIMSEMLTLIESIGGFKGEAQDAPSGINQKEKLRLLESEGVHFDERGCLKDVGRWWNEFRT